MPQSTRILQRETEELTPVEEEKLRERLMFLRSQSRTPLRSPPLQRRPSDTEPLVIASGSGTQDHTHSSPARTSLMKNLNLKNNPYNYSDDDGDYDQQQSSSSCPHNMDHKHHHNLLNSNSNKLSHKHSTTSTFDTYSTAPTAPVSSSSRGNVTNPFEDPAYIEPFGSSSSTPSTIPSSSSSPQPHPLYRTNPNSSSLHPHPHPPHALHSNHGLDGTVSANTGFTAGTTHSGLPIPGLTHKRKVTQVNFFQTLEEGEEVPTGGEEGRQEVSETGDQEKSQKGEDEGYLDCSAGLS
ncbi:hypothetical protein QBC45DRAFT_373113 [Copromyces sp. CBS 386.78]|nr:hypothetical protein QBC45DRAFT_373113 [Copromyces sp. CBS 386.78]